MFYHIKQWRVQAQEPARSGLNSFADGNVCRMPGGVRLPRVGPLGLRRSARAAAHRDAPAPAPAAVESWKAKSGTPAERGGSRDAATVRRARTRRVRWLPRHCIRRQTHLSRPKDLACIARGAPAVAPARGDTLGGPRPRFHCAGIARFACISARRRARGAAPTRWWC